MNIFSKIQKVEKLSPGLRNLYLHRILRLIGWGFVGMFGVIFVFKMSGSLKLALFFYGITSLLYVFFLPLAAKALRLASMHKFMALSTVFLILYLIGFYWLDQVGYWQWWVIIFLIVVSTLNKLCYWIPYHVDIARFINRHHRGRQLSFLSIIISLISVVLPIFSGWVINRFGFAVLFVLAIIGIVFSALPLIFVPRTRVTYIFGYLESFKKIFSGHHFKTNLAYFADGFQGGTGILVWPIFIFSLLDGNYLEVGGVSAAIILVTSVLRFLVGEAADRFDKNKMARWGSWLYALGWLIKGAVGSAFHIFVAGTYHNLTATLVRTPLDTLTYEIAADEGHYVDEFSVLREMSLHLGRVMAVVLAIMLVSLAGLFWVFMLTAVMSLLLSLVSKDEFYLLCH